MTKILVLGLGAVLSVYGVYLCVKGMMWAYFKFQDSYDDLQTALRKFGDFKKKDGNESSTSKG